MTTNQDGLAELPETPMSSLGWSFPSSLSSLQMKPALVPPVPG